MHNKLDQSDFYLIIGKLGRILEVHLVHLQRGVTGGQGQTTQGVAASAPFPDNCHDLLLDGVGQGNAGGSNTHVCAPVNHTFRGALWRTCDYDLISFSGLRTCENSEKGKTYLNKHLGTTVTLSWSAVHRHGLPVTGELQSHVLLHELFDHLLEDKEIRCLSKTC